MKRSRGSCVISANLGYLGTSLLTRVVEDRREDVEVVGKQLSPGLTAISPRSL